MANFLQTSTYKPNLGGNLNADISSAVMGAFSSKPAGASFTPSPYSTSMSSNGTNNNPFAVSPLSGVTAGGMSMISTPSSTGVANHTKQSILGISTGAMNGPSQTDTNGKYVATGVNAGIDPYTVGQTKTTGVASNNSSIPSAQPAVYGISINSTPSANNLQGVSTMNVPSSSYNPVPQNSLLATANSYMTTPTGYTTDANGNVTQNPDTGDNGRTAILNRVLGDTGMLGQKGQATNQLNSQFGVDQKQQNYIDALNSYNMKKVQYAQQEEAFKNSPQGINNQHLTDTTFGVMQRQNNADLANLAVIATNAQGNYQASMDIVKRKIDAEFDPIQQEVDNLSKFIQTNNDNLTNSDKISLENQRFQLQTNLDLLKSAKESAHQFALQQGITDPSILAKIDASGTPAQAYGAVGMSGDGSAPQSSNQGNESSLSQTSAQYVDHSSDGVPYVDRNRLDNMTPYQKQIASAEYAKAGIRVLDSADVQALGTIDEAKQNLTLFANAADGLLSSGLLGRIKGYTSNQLAQLVQTNPQWRQFQTLRTGLIKSVQGVASGAPGLRVTGAELANAAEALPNSFDNKESAQQAISTFTKLLDVNRNVLLRGSAPQSSQSSGTGIVQTKAGAINTDW